jgi:2,4-dienoyl-CoA reductase-like NADH-dependent reductase (Old Yellow Enzyme family)
VDPNISTAAKEGTRTPKTHKRSDQRSEQCSVEVLAAYSHSPQAVDLRLCHTVALTGPVRPRPSAKRPRSLRERLEERDIADLITAYREGTTAASLAAAHGVSLKSVKRLLHIAGVRRTSPTRRTTKATPVAQHP